MSVLRKIGFSIIISLLSLSLLAACSNNGDGAGANEEGKVRVVSSFSVLHDVVQNVGGDLVEASFLTPIGEDPHEFEPTPSTFQLISDADLLIFNGFNMDYWIQGLAQNAQSNATEVIVTQGVESIPLSADAGEMAGMEDPHAWLDPKNVMIYAENIKDALVQADPDHADQYEANLKDYLAELEELDTWIKEEVEQIPAGQRMVIISESALKYFARGYDFQYNSIWEINAHEEGSPRQIENLINVIEENEIPAVFLETSVNPSAMERVASEAGIEIAGRVYTDSVGGSGTGAETYIDMMKRNVETFVEGLTGN
ncbi:iron/zinc/copper transport system substrate-binding protein [Bacillus horti]|uniref:Iron/zinc/copper transport system substrate-binding protein n=1 Tax=Caldalkalibacillus horti TaxID=77523 RepID=A0ABT9VU62_9BACI|nr:iron/zinc/copper transport system substrate-binding protein [Bacillus horti]